ncbi:MAG TPA: acetoacetate decarboxylase family protein [Candidatus Binataceae bacterium]|nr:acetoacetate decarboxylase family protein [Candidatus Binataceae bacterium]
MPPRYGTLDLSIWGKSAPVIDGYGTDRWLLKGAQILELHWEIDDEPADALLPRTMHPVIPAYCIINVTHYPDSPVGAFSTGEVRIAGRAGVRPRGFVLRSYCNSEAARREMASRWGYPVAPGEVSMILRHDRVIGKVVAGGRPALEIELTDRDLISGADIQYIASMHLARNREDNDLVLVQVDPEYTFTKGERGRPRVVTLDNDAFGAGNHLRLTNPIMASFATADVTMPKIRFVCNPALPAMQGTAKVAA